MYWVYIRENPAGRFYIGSTWDLPRRIEEHSSPDKALSSTAHKNGAWRIVRSEERPTGSSALTRDRAIKRMKSAAWIGATRGTQGESRRVGISAGLDRGSVAPASTSAAELIARLDRRSIDVLRGCGGTALLDSGAATIPAGKGVRANSMPDLTIISASPVARPRPPTLPCPLEHCSRVGGREQLHDAGNRPGPAGLMAGARSRRRCRRGSTRRRAGSRASAGLPGTSVAAVDGRRPARP